MKKSDIIAALEKIHGDPEVAVKVGLIEIQCPACWHEIARLPNFTIDRINEYPRPEIVVIEK